MWSLFAFLLDFLLGYRKRIICALVCEMRPISMLSVLPIWLAMRALSHTMGKQISKTKHFHLKKNQHRTRPTIRRYSVHCCRMMNANDEVHGRFSIRLCMVIFSLSLPPYSSPVYRFLCPIESDDDDIITIFIIIYWRLFNLCRTMRECISTRSLARSLSCASTFVTQTHSMQSSDFQTPIPIVFVAMHSFSPYLSLWCGRKTKWHWMKWASTEAAAAMAATAATQAVRLFRRREEKNGETSNSESEKCAW